MGVYGSVSWRETGREGERERGNKKEKQRARGWERERGNECEEKSEERV